MSVFVFFDVDGVLIRQPTLKLFIRYLFSKGEIKLLVLMKYLWWFLLLKLNLLKNFSVKYEEVLNDFKNTNVSKTESYIKDFFSSVIIPGIEENIVGIINKHKQNGDVVILVSSSVADIINLLREYLGLEYSIATELEVENGMYTGKKLNLIPYGKNKVIRIKEFIKEKDLSLDDSWAYTDSISDLPLLEFVNNPYAVNPDTELRSEAKVRGWPIIELNSNK